MSTNNNVHSIEEARAEAGKLNVSQAIKLYYEVANATPEDFLVWSKAPYWTIDEATALSLGKNPKLVNWLTIQPHLEVSDFARQYAILRDAIKRAIQIKALKKMVEPYAFIGWAKFRLVTFPPSLYKAVEEFQASTQKPFKESASKREMNNLYLLIYIMAKEKYGYKNGCARAIEQIIKSIKDNEIQPLSDDTIFEKIQLGKQVAQDRQP
jgi:hypothetical protein